MVTLTVVAILLTINMVLMHSSKLGELYSFLYKKVCKPKFEVGEFVMINDLEYEIILVTKSLRPYTYLCLPVNLNNTKMYEAYYHESEIKKKVGLLKELE